MKKKKKKKGPTELDVLHGMRFESMRRIREALAMLVLARLAANEEDCADRIMAAEEELASAYDSLWTGKAVGM